MSKRILVVEDQSDNRQIIRDMLAATDYEITEVETGDMITTSVIGRVGGLNRRTDVNCTPPLHRTGLRVTPFIERLKKPQVLHGFDRK